MSAPASSPSSSKLITHVHGAFAGIDGVSSSHAAALASSFAAEHGSALPAIVMGAASSSTAGAGAGAGSGGTAEARARSAKSSASFDMLRKARRCFAESMYEFVLAMLDRSFFYGDTLLGVSKDMIEKMCAKVGTREETDFITWIDGVYLECMEAIGSHLDLIKRQDDRLFIIASRVEALRIFQMETRATRMTPNQKNIVFKHMEKLYNTMRKYGMFKIIPPLLFNAIRTTAENIVAQMGASGATGASATGGPPLTKADLNPLKLGTMVVSMCTAEVVDEFTTLVTSGQFNWADMFIVLKDELSNVGVSFQDVMDNRIDPNDLYRRATSASASASATSASTSSVTATATATSSSTSSGGGSGGSGGGTGSGSGGVKRSTPAKPSADDEAW